MKLQSFRKQLPLVIGAAVIFVITGCLIYFMYDSYRYASKIPSNTLGREALGQLGDYFGGILNPVVGLISILLLATTYRHALVSQKSTEAALEKQIDIAGHTRDMNNAIALWAHLDVSCVNINKKIGMEIHKTNNRNQKLIDQLTRDLANTVQSRDDVGLILTSETNRLRTKYLYND